MPYLIGTDEAGYGPNLGPLVVSASVWEAPEGAVAEQLYERLAAVIVRKPERNGGCGGARVAIADSKVLYQSGKGLALLERGLLASLGALGRQPRRWRALWDVLDPHSVAEQCSLPWHVDYDCALPIEVESDDLHRVSELVRAGMDAAGVRLVDIASRAIFPERFNRLVSEHDSKGAALSHTTIALVAEQIARLPEGRVLVVCDKHGGRNYYRDLLCDHFPDAFIEIHGEGRERSVYRFVTLERRVEIRFQTKAEAWLPAALASMASKYLREMSMRAFNDFWMVRVPALRPTAGYPQDAKRFLADIADVQSAMGIEDRILWRVK